MTYEICENHLFRRNYDGRKNSAQTSSRVYMGGDYFMQIGDDRVIKRKRNYKTIIYSIPLVKPFSLSEYDQDPDNGQVVVFKYGSSVSRHFAWRWLIAGQPRIIGNTSLLVWISRYYVAQESQSRI